VLSDESWPEVDLSRPGWRRLRADLTRLRQSPRCEPDCHVPVGVVHEPWLTKQELATHLGFSLRWVELRVREGMPCERFGSRLRFQRTEVEQWLKRSAVA
jgi:excisionase family DNA binding protein